MGYNTGWRYRIASSVGTCVLVVLSVVVADHPLAQAAITAIPPFDRLDPTVLVGSGLLLAVATTLPIVLIAMVPLFKPQPRRILDTISITLRRVLTAALALAAIGYFNYTYRLPRTTLLLSTLLLCIGLPAWFVAIRRRPETTTDRVLLIGDDPDAMDEVLRTADLPVVGYIAPAMRYETGPDRATIELADGGTRIGTRLDGIECLGGLSDLDDVLVEHDIDTAVLAFERSDRTEFFGALATCYTHGVVAKVHLKHADSVLTSEASGETLIDTNLEPWDPQDRAVKRAFDVCFAFAGLVALLPIILVIAVGIKLDDGGPLFYAQERTAEFGETFQVLKFRSMVPDSEDATPIDDRENTRITRVGRLLRRTHFDEIPQLVSILVGDMSVVGPRAVWVDEEPKLEAEIRTWRKRWFVKPGLTGLAQINRVSSTDPQAKFRYDIKYINEQSFWFDLQIVVRQVWQVVTDLVQVTRV